MAPPEQSMNTIIHAAFRRDLARFDDALATFPAGSRARADELVTAWTHFHEQLHHHHHNEETIFWPALRELGAPEALVGDLAGEHASMTLALDTADAAMTAVGTEVSAANVAAAGDAVRALRANVATHLAHEERDLEPVLLRNLHSPTIKAAEKVLRRSQTQREAGVFFAWLQDGAAPADRRALAQNVPPPVLFVLSRLLGRRYRRQVAPVWTA